MVLLALAFMGLLALVGLVTDVGMLYLTYGQLKRAIDAAAIAAANNFRRGESLSRMTEAAREMLAFHQIADLASLGVYICDAGDADGDGLFEGGADGDGMRDASLQSSAPAFYDLCPDSPTQAPRKFVWAQGTQQAPVFFLHLFGIESVPLTTNAVAEAAAVDVVIVIDTSESMGVASADYADPNDYDPVACNATNSCYPMRQAKDAAKALAASLYDGYDQVAVVTFDYNATQRWPLGLNFGDDDGAADGDAYAAIDGIPLHDDAPIGRLWPEWYANYGYPGRFNPVNPEDRDGNGLDADPPCDLDDDHWDDVVSGLNPYTGPCDDDFSLDAYDWNGNGLSDDSASIAAYGASHGHAASPISTCTGCGLRVASEILRSSGRPDSVWVIVFLSDGVANLSDLPPTINSSFPSGFCGGGLDAVFWTTACIDPNPSNPRYCVDASATACPPASTPTTGSPPYSVDDYARDMIDAAALRKSSNPDEPLGDEVGVYAIGLGAASAGESLLRYIAAVGDDGDRTTDPCAGVAALTNCGQYYYAPSGDQLLPIFEDIASRIFTRITQ